MHIFLNKATPRKHAWCVVHVQYTHPYNARISRSATVEAYTLKKLILDLCAPTGYWAVCERFVQDNSFGLPSLHSLIHNCHARHILLSLAAFCDLLNELSICFTAGVQLRVITSDMLKCLVNQAVRSFPCATSCRTCNNAICNSFHRESPLHRGGSAAAAAAVVELVVAKPTSAFRHFLNEVGY